MNLKSVAIFTTSAAILVAAVAVSASRVKTKTLDDGAAMVMISAGEFIMGDGNGERDERPARAVTIKTYWIDMYEVTYALYDQCVSAGKCNKPKNSDGVKNIQLPVAGISWQDAANYCEYAQKRLPTEAEWEKAARANFSLKYPWGENIDCTYANYRECGVGKALPVGSYPKGASPYTLLDMAGNVYEWVADYYDPEYYKTAPAVDPPGPTSGKYRVVRGGAFTRAMFGMRSADRAGFKPETRADDIGFRCALDD